MTAKLLETDRVWIYVCFKRDSGGYMGKAPGLPGCMTWASTLDEAKENMKDAIAGYLETAFMNDIALEPNDYLRTTPPEEAPKRVSCRPRLNVRSIAHLRGDDLIGEWQVQRTAVAT